MWSSGSEVGMKHRNSTRTEMVCQVLCKLDKLFLHSWLCNLFSMSQCLLSFKTCPKLYHACVHKLIYGTLQQLHHRVAGYAKLLIFTFSLFTWHLKRQKKKLSTASTFWHYYYWGQFNLTNSNLNLAFSITIGLAQRSKSPGMSLQLHLTQRKHLLVYEVMHKERRRRVCLITFRTP